MWDEKSFGRWMDERETKNSNHSQFSHNPRPPTAKSKNAHPHTPTRTRIKAPLCKVHKSLKFFCALFTKLKKCEKNACNRFSVVVFYNCRRAQNHNKGVDTNGNRNHRTSRNHRNSRRICCDILNPTQYINGRRNPPTH